ncbi:MAG: 2-oxoacid:acceptor oxidoreductase subunit alpha [Thermaerobacter sp.]|nr:2-oxoacid:acceptor oxidoreductase subunit alpha [Thermaerobacter sp.]
MISWKIGGEQGEGIDSTGDMLAGALNAIGYYVYGYKTFASRIKGGHTTYKIRFSGQPVESAAIRTDLLVALDQNTIMLNIGEVPAGGCVLADTSFKPALPVGSEGISLVPVPLTEIAKRFGRPVMRNMAAVGASAAIFRLPLEPFMNEVKRRFARKGTEIVEANWNTVQEGYRYVQEHIADVPVLNLPNASPADRMVITGNTALALGALAGGCRIFCGYPITPATDIMETLIEWFPRVGGAVVQFEDELSSIMAAIGAGFAGVRAMTATSGPGLSLMQEAIGLASMAEIPVVVVDAQRAGPSTGMATKDEQSDLMALIYGGHGEGPRVVLAPSSVHEAFADGFEAFNLADSLQTPVLIASDLSLGLNTQGIDRASLQWRGLAVDASRRMSVDELGGLGQPGFERYRITHTGISPRSVPGQKFGQYLATGSEHNTFGKVTENPTNRQAMMDKRWRKLNDVHHMRPGLQVQGPMRAEIALVAIGATAGVVRDVQRQLAEEGRAVSAIWVRTLAPFPVELAQRAMAEADRVIVVEQNATGQLMTLLRQHGVADARFSSLLKYDGIPFTTEDVFVYLKTLRAPTGVTG